MEAAIWALLVATALLLSMAARAADPSVESASLTGEAPPLPAILTLEQASAIALAYNPRLEVFDWALRAADARILQASLRPNPELSLEIEGIGVEDGPTETARSATLGFDGISFERGRTRGGGAGFEEAEITLMLSHRFELGGKRARRIVVAEQERSAAAWDYEVARLAVLTEVARAYVEVLAVQQRRALSEQLLTLAQTVADTIRTRVEAGKVSPIEAERAEVQLSSAAIDKQREEHDLHAAKAGLAAMWAAPAAAFEGVRGTLDAPSPLPALEDLLRMAETNPDVEAWMQETARREAVVDLERSGRVPDLTVGLGLRSTGVDGGNSRGFALDPAPSFSRSQSDFDSSHSTSLVLEASIPLPLFDRNQGRIAEAEHLLSQAHAERRATVADVEGALEVRYEEAVAAREEAERIATESLPLAQKVYDKTQQAYEAGKFGYLEVLDAQRSLFELHARRLDALAEHYAARVELERLMGQALPERIGVDTPTH